MVQLVLLSSCLGVRSGWVQVGGETGGYSEDVENRNARVEGYGVGDDNIGTPKSRSKVRRTTKRNTKYEGYVWRTTNRNAKDTQAWVWGRVRPHTIGHTRSEQSIEQSIIVSRIQSSSTNLRIVIYVGYSWIFFFQLSFYINIKVFNLIHFVYFA